MNEGSMNTISVVGAGSWGTALAQVMASKGTPVRLWARDESLAREINASGRNQAYLGDIPISKNITATSDLLFALKSTIILMVTPAQAMRTILEDMKPHIRKDHVLALCSKGIELETEKLMSLVANDVLPKTPVAILSGPNFALEIASGKPAATTLACADEKIAKTLQNAIGSANFRPYITTDITGVQIAGALKNVIAIACGVIQGMNLGESARASLVTRGMAEIARLGCAMGAQQGTFLGLSGMGDMMLTCSSEKSRNFSLGLQLGQGKTLTEIMENRRNVTEGVHTAKAAIDLAAKYKIEMPVCMAVHKCLNLGASLDEVIHEMLNRPPGLEC